MKELREYQSRIVERAIASDKDDIICLPTGGGKTVIASSIMEQLNGVVLFVVPRLELIRQAQEEFGDVDIIWSDKTSLTGKKCIIASKDSLRIQYKKLPADLKEAIHEGTVIFDECHVSIKQTHSLVEMMKPKRVLGLTATPERMDGFALLKGEDRIHKDGVFDGLIQEETVPSLIRKGFLAPLHYYAKPIDGITDVKPDNPLAEELSGEQMMGIFDDNDIWGDLVESYEQFGKGRPALGFTTTIEMAQIVVNTFEKAGYNFKVIHGGMSIKERRELIDALRDHKIDGLVNAALLTYGFDCPPVSYAFNCRHIKSRPLWFQVVGRILRTCEGKSDAVFVDHGDSISEFAEPDCALPILDELIKWRADGETKEEKQDRKRKRKKVNDVLHTLQIIDPLPVEMVEVTTEDTLSRMMRIIKRLTSENADLSEVIKMLKTKADDLEHQKQQIQREKVQKDAELRKALAQNQRLQAQKASGTIIRHIDKDLTFEYVKQHYIHYRKQIEQEFPHLTPFQAHEMVKAQFEEDRNDLPFLFDEPRYRKSMDWWYENYKNRVQYYAERA